MSSRKGASQFPSLFDDCVLWWPGLETSEFPIIPSGVTVTPNGTFTKDDLGNNKQIIHQNSTNYITITDSSDFYIGTNSFSVCFWLIPSQGSLTGNIGICGQMPSNGSVTNTGWNVYLYNGIPRFYWHNGTTTTGYSSTYGSLSYGIWSGNVITSGSWYHLAFIGNGSILKIYINGIQYGSVACTNIADSPLSFYLGGNQYWTDIAGNLVDFLFYNGKALSQAEIKLLMNRTHPVTGLGMLPGGYDYYRDV